MLCPKCGSDIMDDAVYCPKCGHHFEQTSAETTSPSGNPETEEKISAETFAEVKSDEVFAGVRNSNFFKRVIAMLFSPSREWDKIAQEKPRVPFMIFGYLLILGLVAFVCVFIGGLIKVLATPDLLINVYFIKVTVFSSVKMMALIGTPIIAALIINSLCASFKTEKNFGKVLQVTTYSFTPVFVGWTMFIIPFPFIYYLVQMVSLYGIILLLIGFKKILVIPENKQVGFFFTMVGVLYGVYYMLYWTIQFVQAPVFHMGYNYYSY